MFILLIFLSGCTSPVKDDLLDYINVKLPLITGLENEALNRFDDLVAKPDYTYEELYNLLITHTIPIYSRFLQELKNINPKTNEVKEAHNYYRLGAERQLEAFIALKEGLEEKDKKKLDSVNNILDEARLYMRLFKNKVSYLSNKYHLKIQLQ
jgi:hypothetical protein